MSDRKPLALQLSLVLPRAVRRHEVVVVWRSRSQLGRCAFVTYKNSTADYYSPIIFPEDGDSCHKTGKIDRLSFKKPAEQNIFTFRILPSLQNVIAFFNSKPSGRGGGGIVDVHVTATGCAPQKTQDRRLNK
jgi:hypothetical protein